MVVENAYFSYPVPFNLHDHLERRLWFSFLKILIQNCTSPRRCKILPKSSTLWVARAQQRDTRMTERQTTDRCASLRRHGERNVVKFA